MRGGGDVVSGDCGNAVGSDRNSDVTFVACTENIVRAAAPADTPRSSDDDYKGDELWFVSLGRQSSIPILITSFRSRRCTWSIAMSAAASLARRIRSFACR